MIFGISNSILSTQNVYVARFARSIEWDFFCDFYTPSIIINILLESMDKKVLKNGQKIKIGKP